MSFDDSSSDRQTEPGPARLPIHRRVELVGEDQPACARRRGWLGAMQDPGIRDALGLIHRSPDRGWTAGDLAAAVGMSRSVSSPASANRWTRHRPNT